MAGCDSGGGVEALHFEGEDGVRVVPLAGPTTIGRSRDNDVVFAGDAAISRFHAVVEPFGGGWQVRDLHSRNGTFVNGLRISAPMPVQTGDTVLVAGRAMRFVVGGPDSDIDGETERWNKPKPDGPSLTMREAEVVRLVAGGQTDGEIARSLTISVKTVQSHLDRIRTKTGARRRADLTRLAVELGLVR